MVYMSWYIYQWLVGIYASGLYVSMARTLFLQQACVHALYREKIYVR